MAERLNKRQADSARKLIQTQRIVQELARHLEGEREMSASQIRAAEILLNKSLPNLAQTQLDVEGDMGLQIEIVNYSEAQNTDD